MPRLHNKRDVSAAGYAVDLENAWYFPKNQAEIYVGTVSRLKNGKNTLDVRIWWRSAEKIREGEDVWQPSKKGIVINSRDAANWLMEFLEEHAGDLQPLEEKPPVRNTVQAPGEAPPPESASESPASDGGTEKPL